MAGTIRDFSKTPRDLRTAYEQAQKRRDRVPPMLALERAKVIGADRIRQMSSLLKQFEAESFGCF